LVRRCLIALALVLSCCGQAEERPEVHVASAHQTLAWVGKQDSLTIVAEYLAVADDLANATTSEEALIRERLPDAVRPAYLRVHLFGPAEQVARELELARSPQGFVGFPTPPAELNEVQALFWDAVLRGQPLVQPTDADAIVQRSLVLASDGETLDPSTPSLKWQSGQDYGDLTRRSWGQVARREYFEGLLQPPADEPEESS